MSPSDLVQLEKEVLSQELQVAMVQGWIKRRLIEAPLMKQACENYFKILEDAPFVTTKDAMWETIPFYDHMKGDVQSKLRLLTSKSQRLHTMRKQLEEAKADEEKEEF